MLWLLPATPAAGGAGPSDACQRLSSMDSVLRQLCLAASSSEKSALIEFMPLGSGEDLKVGLYYTKNIRSPHPATRRLLS